MGNETHILVGTGLTKSFCFGRLLTMFEAKRGKLRVLSPYRKRATFRRRRNSLCTENMLGMTLWYLPSADSAHSMCPVFGLTPSSLSQWLDFSLEILLFTVSDRSASDVAVVWPAPAMMEHSAGLLKKKRWYGKLLEGEFGVIDGARMRCVRSNDADRQNAYFQGYTQGVDVTYLLVWAFDETVIHAMINYPGSWHENRLAVISQLYWPKLYDEVTPPGFAVLGDSEFVSNSRATNGKVVRALQRNEIPRYALTEYCEAIQLLLQRLYSRERQSAEWGVRGLRGLFRRLSTTLPSNAYKRYRILSTIVHLVNYPTRQLGHNQIRTVFEAKRLRVLTQPLKKQ